MAASTYTWKAGNSADWSTLSDWTPTTTITPGTGAGAGINDVTLGFNTTGTPRAYIVTVGTATGSKEIVNVATLSLSDGAKSHAFPQLSIFGTLTAGVLSYTAGAVNTLDITVNSGGIFDIGTSIRETGTFAQAISIAGTAGLADLQLGSTAVANSNVAFDYINANAGTISAGEIEYLTGALTGTIAQAISNIAWGDKIVFDAGTFAAGETATLSGTTLTVRHGGTVDLTFTDVVNATTNPATGFIVIGGTIWAVCYAEGTQILTDRGEVPVESLTGGDLVVTVKNGRQTPMPIKWMGRRQIEIANHPHPYTVAPVLIRAGAFRDRVPHRDLLVSPAHAIFVDGKLVPANLLINDMTIVQQLEVRQVTYYHMELERHSVVLAEGLTSESYLDTGNRTFFDSDPATDPYPELHVNAGLRTWQDDACAPLVVDAETIAPIWQELADRAVSLGYERPVLTTTTDADFYLTASGRRLRPVAVARGRHTFLLPAGTTNVTLRSRATAPAELNPLSGDWRPLGVAVRDITLRSDDEHLVIPVDHPDLTQGWHDAEWGRGDLWRWTTGSAALPLPPIAVPTMLDIEFGATATHILRESKQAAVQVAA